MAPRRRAPRPWHRTRVYRLTRTIVLTVVLVVSVANWAKDEERDGPHGADLAGAQGARDAGTSRAPAPRYSPPLTPSPTARPTTATTPRTPPNVTKSSGVPAGAGSAPGVPSGAGAAPGGRSGEASAPAAGGAGASGGSDGVGGVGGSGGPGGSGGADGSGRSRGPGASSGGPGVPGSPSRAAARPTADQPAKPRGPVAPRALPPSPARTVSIPYLGIKAPVMELRLDREGRLPAPPDDRPKLVGWYAAGPAPGGPGTAVVVGHRDTRTGPAVFAALDMVKRGRVVEVRRADGRTAVYTVDAVRTYEKAHFPNELVYGTRKRPELRLITCGGVYDRRKGYASNVVVFAHLTDVRGAAGSG
ncbi:class F sortase [Streptomyces ossamyceticus]|uniref:class F sortase n=1 Tax=Streptomyces ossamyceticus TaxID=249581 RepID=UPI0039C9D60A